MPVRENPPGRANSSPARPVLWSPPGSHLRRKPGLCACSHGSHGETDSVAEEDGFELPVPPFKTGAFLNRLLPCLQLAKQRYSTREGPAVRIRLPPAVSQQRSLPEKEKDRAL